MPEKDLTDISGVGPSRADALNDAGFSTVRDVQAASVDDLAREVEGFGQQTAENIKTNLNNLLENGGVEVTRGEGRPSKLTMQRQENIATMLENSHSIAAACRVCGISQRTFYNWLEKGSKQDEGIYSEFLQRVTRARGHGEQQLVDELLEMAREQQDTRALLSVLKSRFPESWGDADAEDDGAQVNVFLTADRDDA